MHCGNTCLQEAGKGLHATRINGRSDAFSANPRNLEELLDHCSRQPLANDDTIPARQGHQTPNTGVKTMISKTTKNMAAKRGMKLEVSEWNNDQLRAAGLKTSRESASVLDIFDSESDASVFYVHTATGWILIGATIGDEWPHMIDDERHLRALLDDMAAVLVG